ncbi:hypothetical protein [Nitrospirillum amazonense]|uniref:hypothetical protein n=1 Tax=Nitrospirillum amazonense TaxID=28077 RepID=UPI00241234F4|nr:hypothetical protein [Nitrospirillum amazonense]MDG3441873.1 hypothetical protein [Nitrospirillum amazonense]
MDTLSLARTDLQKLEAKISRLQEDLRGLENDRVKLLHFIEMAERYSSATTILGATTKRSSVENRGTKGARLVEASLEIMRDTGRPMKNAELANALISMGYEIGGQQPSANLAGFLSRDSRVAFTKGLGWTLAPQIATPTATTPTLDENIPTTSDATSYNEPTPVKGAHDHESEKIAEVASHILSAASPFARSLLSSASPLDTKQKGPGWNPGPFQASTPNPGQGERR